MSDELDDNQAGAEQVAKSKPNPFRYFKTIPEIFRLALIMYEHFSSWLRNVEYLLREGAVDQFAGSVNDPVDH